MNSLSAMTGLPAHGKPKAKGRRPKKPGGDHLGKLTHAHGIGDVKSAVRHALDYANAGTKHLKGAAAMPDDAMDDASDTMRSAPVASPPPAVSGPAGVNKLAAMMRSRAK